MFKIKTSFKTKWRYSNNFNDVVTLRQGDIINIKDTNDLYRVESTGLMKYKGESSVVVNIQLVSPSLRKGITSLPGGTYFALVSYIIEDNNSI